MLKELFQKYLLKYYKLIFILSVIVLISAISFGLIYKLSYRKTDNKFKGNEINDVLVASIKEDKAIDDKEYFYVDLKGAVTNPNVYKVESTSRIVDVIKMAGGLTNEADTSTLNLSKKVIDEMQIIIYTKAEIQQYKENNKSITEVIKYIEKECNCPDPVINDACINEESTNETPSKISINNATKEELMTLPNIGESKANAIIEYRTSNSLFSSIEDIKNVTGIGDLIFDKIKDYITI